MGCGSATIATRLVSCGLLFVSCVACLLAFAGQASALTLFGSGVIATVVLAILRETQHRIELRRARQGGAGRTSDHLAILERENLLAWNVGVVIASALLLWAAPALPAIRWQFIALAVLLLCHGVWHLIRATLSICKRQYIDAACAETARQDGRTISVQLSALDPQILALLRQKRMWVFHSLSKETFYLTRVTLTGELRSYNFFGIDAKVVGPGAATGA